MRIISEGIYEHRAHQQSRQKHWTCLHPSPDTLCWLLHSTRRRFIRRRAPPTAFSAVNPCRPVLAPQTPNVLNGIACGRHGRCLCCLEVRRGVCPMSSSRSRNPSGKRSCHWRSTWISATLSVETRVPYSGSLFLRRRDETPCG